jgi:opacity protein-like surface antigen
MKKLTMLLLVAALAIIAIPTAVMAQATLPFTTDLIADGRDSALDVGDLTVDADGIITFQIDEASTDWRLDETHLYVGDLAPAKSAPGQFTFKHEDLGGVAQDVYNADFAAYDVDGDGIVYVAAHAGLIMQIGEDPDTGEPIYDYESAWAQGDEAIGKGKNWATCFSVTVPVVETPAE